MDSPDILSSSKAPEATSNSDDFRCTANLIKSPNDGYTDMREHALANVDKPSVPNVNVPEHIIICLDVCYDKVTSLYRLGDGTTFTPLNMMKRVLDFFLFTKHAINKKTQFALVILSDSIPRWIQDFTNNVKDIINAIDYLTAEDCSTESFDFVKLFQLIKLKVEIPEYKQGESISPPPFVVRLVVLYGRSNCIPSIPQEDPFFNQLKKHLYFYIDILLAHEEDCSSNKCEEVYDAFQELDNGYSYVFEVSRNATKIHDCIAKLLAHPLQRPLQKNTDYSFGTKL